MAWIKMRNNLDDDPRVVQMAAVLDVDELFVVGMLYKLWTWADQHSLNGDALSVTQAFLDRHVRYAGFSQALRKVGWLEGEDGCLCLPRFEEHNGETAKKRAQSAKRMAKLRGKGKDDDSRVASPPSPQRNNSDAASVTKPSPEKRREEKNREKVQETPPKPPQGGECAGVGNDDSFESPNPPPLTIGQATEIGSQLKIPEEGVRRWFNARAGADWVHHKNGQPMKFGQCRYDMQCWWDAYKENRVGKDLFPAESKTKANAAAATEEDYIEGWGLDADGNSHA